MSRSHSPIASANHTLTSFRRIADAGSKPCRVAAIAVALAGAALTAHADAPAPVAASVIGSNGAPAQRPPDTAAIVDGHTISLTLVDQLAMRQDGSYITSRLIDNFLVDRECKKRGITIPQSVIDDRVNTLAKAIAPQTLEDGLKDHHETLADLQGEIRESMEREELVIDKVQPTRIVNCRAILVRFSTNGQPALPQFPAHTETEALSIINDVQKQLKAGKDFGDLAKQYSEDVPSKDKGGEVGFIFDGSPVDQDLIRAALTLKKGEISQSPVRVPYGYYILQVLSTSDSHPADEDSSYAAAQDKYRHQQAEYLVPDYLKNLRAQAKIVNYIP